MNLLQVNLAQSVRLADQANKPDSTQETYLSDAIQAIKERYKFLQVPTTLEEHDFGKGVRFLRGWFTKSIIIDKLELYNNGLICEAKHPTELIDDFLNDFLVWARSEFGLPNLTGPRSYLSNIEVQSDIGVGHKLDFLSEIGQTITATLRGYGQAPNPFSPTLIGFGSDTTNVPSPLATTFQFDRRAGESYSKNIYFSSAPLATKDQLRILEKLEAAFAG